MISQEELNSKYFKHLHLGEVKYFPVVRSTNDLAMEWARMDAGDGALVIADAQTGGRGRENRQWVTRPGCALAFSLILRPDDREKACISRFTALAALGLIQALEKLGIEGKIKWPNDILLDGKKLAGILVEMDWQAGQVGALVIGVGVNVSVGSVPDPVLLRYPATSIEDALGAPVDRWLVLADVLKEMKTLRSLITGDEFIHLWNAHLAFRNAWVSFRQPGQAAEYLKVLGVQADGQLVLERAGGERLSAPAGEILMDDPNIISK
jgi:BirA family biotin operon repressor/biotin-[acetyl-CoA-carboxylase] ligase